jgi:hypothetical protein
MFLFCLRNFADEEQQKKWLGLAEKKAILGTYAQTEVSLFNSYHLVGSWF